LSRKTAEGTVIPEDLVVVGYVTGAYGIQGWVRIKPYSADADTLLQVKTWWIDKPDLHDVEMLEAKNHSGDVVAKLMGVADRDAAQRLKGTTVQVPRSRFPALSDDEFYWVDLIGLPVENLQGEAIGMVGSMMDNGVHPILQITPPGDPESGKAAAEILIPFVDQYVKSVDLAARKITVDWGLDY
jgi:16S rRNA processing protein RimM